MTPGPRWLPSCYEDSIPQPQQPGPVAAMAAGPFETSSTLSVTTLPLTAAPTHCSPHGPGNSTVCSCLFPLPGRLFSQILGCLLPSHYPPAQISPPNILYSQLQPLYALVLVYVLHRIKVFFSKLETWFSGKNRMDTHQSVVTSLMKEPVRLPNAGSKSMFKGIKKYPLMVKKKKKSFKIGFFQFY